MVFYNMTLNKWDINEFSYEQMDIGYKTHEYVYRMENATRDRKPLGKLKEFDNRDCYELTVINGEFTNKEIDGMDYGTQLEMRKKVFVAFGADDVFVHDLHRTDKNRNTVLYNYKRLKGEPVKSTEDKIWELVKEVIQREDFGIVIDTRHRIEQNRIQEIKLSDRRTRARYEEVYNYFGRPLPKWVRLYPDLINWTLRKNRKGNDILELYEIELGKHPVEDFMLKLLKLQSRGNAVHFIVADDTFDYHMNLIEEFLSLEVNGNHVAKRFNTLSVSRLSEFLEKGFKARFYF